MRLFMIVLAKVPANQSSINASTLSGGSGGCGVSRGAEIVVLGVMVEKVWVW